MSVYILQKMTHLTVLVTSVWCLIIALDICDMVSRDSLDTCDGDKTQCHVSITCHGD